MTVTRKEEGWKKVIRGPLLFSSLQCVWVNILTELNSYIYIYFTCVVEVHVLK